MGIYLLFLVGIVLGSFLAALTYRYPRGISVVKGRSYCPKCKATINWYDNVPLFSYLILKARCRNCHSPISLRYPIIEMSTGIVFVLLYLFLIGNGCVSNSHSLVCFWKNSLGIFALPYIAILAFVYLSIFIIDLENQFIPDELVYISLSLTVFAILFASTDKIYLHFFSGFLVSFLLLILNIATRGRGMGLGDVKLVIPVGIFLGWPAALYWLLISFVLGGMVGIVLIVLGKTSFGKHIAFGPFLIFSFFLMLFWGDIVIQQSSIYL